MTSFIKTKVIADIHTLPPCYVCNSVSVRITYEDPIYRLLRCSNCGLCFVDQILKYEELESQSSDVKNYDENHGRYHMKQEKTRAFIIEREKMRAILSANQTIRLRNERKLHGNRLLDIGCGFGFFLKKMDENGWEVYGCERENIAKEYAEKMKLKVYKDLKNENLWIENVYDVITFWNVLDILDDPLAMLKDCKFLLRKGGTIIVRVPNFSSERFIWKIDELRGKKRSLLSSDCIRNYSLNLYYFTVPSMKSILKQAGFIDPQLIPSPLGDKSYSLVRRYGQVKGQFIVKLAEYLNLLMVRLSLSRSAGFLSITMIAYKPTD